MSLTTEKMEPYAWQVCLTSPGLKNGLSKNSKSATTWASIPAMKVKAHILKLFGFMWY